MPAVGDGRAAGEPAARGGLGSRPPHHQDARPGKQDDAQGAEDPAVEQGELRPQRPPGQVEH